jgi:3-phosphoshikimate 1-carboxyvinyltransferase
MDVQVALTSPIKNKTIAITGSKSETNRLLLLKALYPNITIENVSESDDSEVMQKALASGDNVIDVHHAGTAMRFLAAYFAIQEGSEVLLTGSDRMKERPISVLVDALRTLGADIKYAGKEGYPPLRIKGKKLEGGSVNVNANVSSQYLSALLLIGSNLKKGIELTLEGEITSLPYLQMTIALLCEAGIEAAIQGDKVIVRPVTAFLPPKTIVVESDWSSASYYYSVIALSKPGTEITLTNYKENSLQGDSGIVELYSELGVKTTFGTGSITLTKSNASLTSLNLNLNNTPDIAQTIAVTCAGLGVNCTLTGLHTLKIKETDRLSALKHELEKFGAQVKITDDSITISPGTITTGDHVAVETYNDHRMAMAFAPLAVKKPIIIKDAGVVSKSYPTFWNDLRTINFSVKEL